MNPGVRSLAKQMVKIPKAEWVAKFASNLIKQLVGLSKGLAK